MNLEGFEAEDDLMLYAMQALPEAEMELVRRRIRREPELEAKLASIEATLGMYAAATTEMREVPPSALGQLQNRVAQERPRSTGGSIANASPQLEKPGQGLWKSGLLWAGWALAAVLLVTFALTYRQGRVATIQLAAVQQEAGSHREALRDAKSKATSLEAELDRLRSSSDQQDAQIKASTSQADQAKARSEVLAAKVAESTRKAQEETERADGLTASANQLEAERKRLGEALSKEQQIAASAAESQRVLAAIADPAALHVTLTEPKEKKRPSGRGTYLASNGTLVFTGSNLESLPADKVYELWLLPKDGTAPVPAGTFRPDQAGNATVISSHFQQVNAAGFAITVENAGGSNTPTMPIRLVGTT